MDFVACRVDSADIAPGQLTWLPKPDSSMIPDEPPSLTLQPGENGGVDMSVGWGFISVTVTATVVDGAVHITTSNPLIPSADLQKFQDDLNADLRDNGKQFDRVEIVDGKLRMTKRPLVAARTEHPTVAQPAPAPTPVVAPQPKPLLGTEAPGGVRRFVRTWQGKAAITTGTLALGVAAFFLFTDNGEPLAIPSTTTTTTTSTTTTTTTTTTLAQNASFDDPQLAAVVDPLDQGLGPDAPNVQEVSDPTGDFSDSVSTNTVANRTPTVDIVMMYAAVFDATMDEVDGYFNNSIYECGQSDPLVVCTDGVIDFPAGRILMVAVQMAAPIETDSADTSYIYSLVFDSDGDPANNWVPNPPFDWDYFQGTDLWYQAIYDHTTGTWAISSLQVSAGNQVAAAATSVRAIVSGSWIVWFVPEREIAHFPGAFRATAFAHDGQYTEATRGGDVTGENPTSPLFTLSG